MRKLGFTLTGILVLACFGFFAFSWRPSIEAVTPPRASDFTTELTKHGEQLFAMGNCTVCHTRPGGQFLAGGLPIRSEFGTIYSTNITPDPETGIGRWSEGAFKRAMREGVDRAGQHLYPAFPYDHFTLLGDGDVEALYAYAMTRPAVRYTPPANDLTFPFNLRMGIAAWKVLYFREGRYRADPKQSANWNRGAYLAEGLTHCGACHTPRNAVGAEKKDEAYAGASVEGWYAYALNNQSPAPVPWTEDALGFFLGHGWHKDHGGARGPMVPVAMNLSTAPASDVQAIAAYIASIAGKPSAGRVQRGEEILAKLRSGGGVRPNTSDSLAAVSMLGADGSRGQRIYAAACASCHESGRGLPFGGLNLLLSTAVNGPNPTNIVNVTLEGLPQQPGNASPIMPGFHGSLTNQQLEDLLNYLRERFSGSLPWPDVEKDVKAGRSGNAASRSWPAAGLRPALPNVSAEAKPW